jgi:hypothetical protein
MRLFFTIYLKEGEKIFLEKKNFGTYNNNIRCNNEERRPYNTYINYTEMQDYNDDNYEYEDEDDLFGTHRLQEEVDKQMFLQDCARGFPLVLDPIEYQTIFGPLREEDTEELTQVFFSHYHRLGVTVDTLVDNWGLDWIWVILKDCERREEYELCGIIMIIIEEYSNPQLNKLLGLMTGKKNDKVKSLI